MSLPTTPPVMCVSCGSVSVSHYVSVDAPTPHVEYVIQYDQAQLDGNTQTFTTSHRFSDFLALHKLLLTSKLKLPDLQQQFPSAKHFMHPEAVLQQRRVELERYLQDLVEMCEPGLHPALCRFVCSARGPNPADLSRDSGREGTGDVALPPQQPTEPFSCRDAHV